MSPIPMTGTVTGELVKLTQGELAIAAMVATQRSDDGEARGRKPAYGQEQPGRPAPREADHPGAIGEMAVAKYLQRYWTGMGSELACGDVGLVEVRAVTDSYRGLLLHPEDKDEVPYVLAQVTLVGAVDPGAVVLRGWVWGKDGKQPQWWRETWPSGKPARCYRVPPEALKPMSALLSWSRY